MKAVNLLPPDLRGAAKKPASVAGPVHADVGGAGPFLVLGALAVGVVCLAAYVLAGNSVKDRQAELARVTADSQRLTVQVAALKPYADFEALALSRVQTVQALASQRFDWEQALRDLSHALPTDVHLTALDAKTGADAVAPVAGAVVAAAVPSVELQGCTSTHTDVARLMSRLRTVRGVTRVALTKSDKGSIAAGSVAQVTTAGVARPARTCPKGSPPVFDLTMFFANAVVPAPAVVVATTVPAQPGAAATPVAPAAAVPANGAPAAVSAPGAAGTAQTTPASATQGVSK